MDYTHLEIENKWRQFWAENKTFKAEDASSKPKYYVLDMFPYPSGAGLHVGHPLGYIASDIVSRYKRHKGFNVLHPMGYDSFGLPAEQYAIQTGQHPAITTEQNIARYREQLDKIGFSFDWDREVRTSNPDYYKWTQWIFIQLFNSWYNPETDKAEPISTLIETFNTCPERSRRDQPSTFNINGVEKRWDELSEKEQSDVLMDYRLAYLGEAYVNWCPALGTVLANDEVKDGVSERGGHPVERKLMKQWSMRITAYAERLLKGLDSIDWTESLKESQRNWIGKSEGTSLKFHLSPTLSKGEGAPGYHTTDGQMWNLLIDKAKEMRTNPTPAEDALWQQLRAKSIEYKFRRQQIIDRFIVDFVCLDRQLVVEVDGDIHDYQQEEDAARTSALEERGYKVIRFRNEEVLADTENVLSKIKNELEQRPSFKESLPLGEVGGVISVFTTRPDTIFGVSFLTLAPEHELVSSITTPEQKQAVEEYVIKAKNRSERERQADVNTISGVFTGAYAEHPFSGKQIPIWVGDYVLAGYGTGAVMAVPAHDERDYKFAKHFGLDIPIVVSPFEGGKGDDEHTPNPSQAVSVDRQEGNAYSAKEGKLINSDFLNGLDVKDAIKKAIEEIEKKNLGKGKTNYRLRDAVFGRQRYWGEPIPIYYKQLSDGTTIPCAVDEKDLPIVLPEVDKYLPTEDGDPPLARAKNWSYSTPSGELEGALETTTMPGWAGSSWYFLRYMDPKNTNAFVSKQAADYWQQIDLYMGGSEHATGHLLYFRFWTKFLKDLGYISIEEPAKKLINQGMIQGRSNFVYRYAISVINGEPISPIFVSKNIALKTNNTDANYLNELENLVKKRVPNFSLNLPKGTQRHHFHEIHVDVNLVENDILNIDAFKSSRDEFINADFICEDGQYICGWEIEKMSKSKYNVVTPDDIVEKYGADTLRMYEMFLGPLEQSKPWNTNGITGVHNFLKKLWRLVTTAIEHEKVSPNGGDLEGASKDELKILHETIKKIAWDIENFSFNTSISQFMICVNKLTELKCTKREVLEPLLICLSPYAPHICEELWQRLGHTESIEFAPFPQHNEAYLQDDNYNYPISINGKVRVNLEFPLDTPQDVIQAEVLKNEVVQKWLEGKQPKKIIVVPKRIVNLVV
jgi:leucyl-tRNA synthetase